MEKQTKWSTLPDDVYGRVLDFLTAKDLGSVGIVSTKLQRLAIDRRRWERLFFRDFSLHQQPRSRGQGHVLPVSSSLLVLMATTSFKTRYISALKSRSVKLRRNATLRTQLAQLQLADWRGNRLRVAFDACYGIIFPIIPIISLFITAVLIVLYADGRLGPSATGFTPFIPSFIGIGVSVAALCVGFVQDQRCSEGETDPASALYMQHAANEDTLIGAFTSHMGEHINVERCARLRQLYILAQMLCVGMAPICLAMRAGNVGPFATVPYAVALLPVWVSAALLMCLPFGCGARFRCSRAPHVIGFTIFLSVFLFPFLASVIALLLRVDAGMPIRVLYIVIPILCTAILACLTGATGICVCLLKLLRRRRQNGEMAVCSLVIGIVATLCIIGEVLIVGHFDGWYTRGLGAAASPLLLLLGIVTLIAAVAAPIPLINARARRETSSIAFRGLYSAQGYSRPDIAAQKRLITDAIDLV